ncbi:lytic transglycosylase domain-containing protein [Limnohabitans parvus]|uniref:Transglycosylase SLT domain-containing protein n=1 Tax=Limnohabitans parvus II-B4 TaxID=1293052 RepID=A0A315EF78_9BURK|nr:lytic transglycosylase domain-containing protein [Limnohabitans parvus]PUE54484.1 hypothetical protein B9Z37_08120 [Limnohabitans parvus II-B4]
MSRTCTWCQHFRTFLRDVAHGLFIITHSGLAMVGLTVAALVLALWLRPDWLRATEGEVFNWLRERQVLLSWLPENTAERATAVELKDLPADQAAVAQWLGQKYSIAPEPLAALVAEAHVLSKKHKFSPYLILSVMAIESGFHPYAQSSAGAQGLMQVMTDIHIQRYAPHGGPLAAFDPITNMRVGADVLAYCIRTKAGVMEDGLRYYLGAAESTDDGGYVAKVLLEQDRLTQVANGVKSVPMQ